jgi:hypothetical protein
MVQVRWLNIPAELRARPQWAVATLAPIGNGEFDKAPRDPHTGRPVDVTNPSTWVSFDEAANSGYPAIGYILDASDPFVIIDLDYKTDRADEIARQDKIRELFHSYTERSQSGRGFHIIMPGRIGGGIRRDGVEVYDQQRFMICTGDRVNGASLVEQPELLAQLVAEMGGVAQGAEGLPASANEVEADDDIIRKCEAARNADKFKDLFYRRPSDGEDWSQRDASLAQIIAFHTRNHEQALRLFRRSALYRPGEKGKSLAHYEQYYLLERTFGRAWRAEMVRDADIDFGREVAAKLLAGLNTSTQTASSGESVSAEPAVADEPRPTVKLPPVTFPNGLIGEIANFIYHASPRPVAEVALAGALAFTSGLLGRQFNISRSGLNLYIVLIAGTGRGKEGAASGIDALITSLRQKAPVLDQFQGPGHIASGQALIKALNEHPSMFSVLSEFGHMLKIVTDPRASAADIRTRQVLLDLFSKSGRHQILQASIYSDREKNTKAVQAPCYSFLGDTTPETFFGGFSADMVAEGLLPRFLTVTYDGPRVPANKAPILSPTQDLQDRLITVLTSVANMYHSNTFVDIAVEDEAQRMLDEFDRKCDAMINNDASRAAHVELWNRAHLKLLRIAGLVAVGRNIFEPRVEKGDVEWAQSLIERELLRFSTRVEKGDVGADEVQQIPEVVKATLSYLKLNKEARVGYGALVGAAERDMIPYGFFRRRFRNVAAFLKDRRGCTGATKGALQDAVELGILQEVPFGQLVGLTGARADSKYYVLGAMFPKEA